MSQTDRRLVDRIEGHLNCIRLQKDITGVQYTSNRYNHYNLQVQVIEKISPNTPTSEWKGRIIG